MHNERTRIARTGHAFLILFLFIALISASESGCQGKDPLKIGFIAGLTGRGADLGISGRDALQMAIEQANKEGGINGRHILLIIKDDEQDPEKARKAAKALIDEGASAIIGPMTSDMAMAVAPVMNQARKPFISPTATTQLLSGEDDYFFRVTSSAEEFAVKNASYHIKTGDMKRISAVYDLNNRSFCENWLKIFKKYFTSHGGEIIFTSGFDTSLQYSFQNLAQELLSHNPDGILVIANSMDSAMICQQVRKINKNINITLADWGATERLLELGGKAVEGVTVIQTFNRYDATPPYMEFRKEYMKRFKREPGFPGVYTHEAANVVITALKNQNKSEELKETMLRLKRFKGLQKDFEFDAFGDVKRGNSSISVVRGQQFVVLE